MSQSKQWDRILLVLTWFLTSSIMALQLILSFFLYNASGIQLVRYGGFFLWIIAAVLGWWPIFTLRSRGNISEGGSYIETNAVVSSGPYAIVRHPQYLAFMLINTSLMLITQHWAIVILGLFGILFNYIIIIKEETHLLDKFGDEYEHYKRTVPRINMISGTINLIRQNNQ